MAHRGDVKVRARNVAKVFCFFFKKEVLFLNRPPARSATMSTVQSLENHEHAEHAAGHGAKNAALLVAVLAALLALTEVQAKHAEILVEESSILAADSWNQYQAKSIRQAVARDLGRLAGTLDTPADPARAMARAAIMATLADDQSHYETDPKDGKKAIAKRAQDAEATRDHTLERAHAFDNAAAALELGIVLSTASAITSSRMLIRIALGLGVVGIGLAALGFTHPEAAAF
jgi:hypothetical protein